MIIIQANGAEGDLEEKILALLRREDIAAERVSLSSRHTLTFPELTIDGRSQQAFQNGTALALTRIEFNMLLLLASNPGVTLSKEDLFSAVWGPGQRGHPEGRGEYRLQSPSEDGRQPDLYPHGPGRVHVLSGLRHCLK